MQLKNAASMDVAPLLLSSSRMAPILDWSQKILLMIIRRPRSLFVLGNVTNISKAWLAGGSALGLPELRGVDGPGCVGMRGASNNRYNPAYVH